MVKHENMKLVQYVEKEKVGRFNVLQICSRVCQGPTLKI